MTGVCKFLAVLFGACALASLGHDLWRAASIGNRFTLSEIGWLFHNYAPDAHDAFRETVATMFGAKFFNAVFGTLFSTYTLIVTGLLCGIFSGLMLWDIRRRNRFATSGRTYRHKPNYD